MADKVAITFDEDNQIRVLEAGKFRETDTLRNEGMSFVSSNLPATFLIRFRNYGLPGHHRIIN
jgi:hypothetical protein